MTYEGLHSERLSESTGIVLLDGSTKWQSTSEVVADWVETEVPSGRISIPDAVDKDASSLRSEFLSWQYVLANRPVYGRPLKSFMRIFNIHSYWWMSAIADGSPLKHEEIYLVLKLRAFEKIYEQEGCKGITYVGRDNQLNEILKKFARSQGHTYRWYKQGRRTRQTRTTFSDWLPQPAQAMISLIFGWARRAVVSRTTGRRHIEVKLTNEHGPTVIVYFPNFESKAMELGQFRSNYFGNLQNLIEHKRDKIRWIWIYVPSSQTSYSDAVRMRDECNQAGKHSHELIEENISVGVFLSVLTSYFKIAVRGMLLGRMNAAFILPGSKINFSPFVRKLWKSSMRGKPAIDAAFFSHLAKSAALKSRSTCLLYPFENQPWEMAVIAAWRLRKTRTVGFQHSAVGALNLNHYYDRQNYLDDSIDAPLIPDKLAFSSDHTRQRYLADGAPANRLVNVESVRYTHLSDTSNIAVTPSPEALLVVLTYDVLEANEGLRMLEEALQRFQYLTFTEIVVKPHPQLRSGVSLRELQVEVRCTLSHQPLQELLERTKVGVCIGYSSAQIEMIYRGIPTICCKPKNVLNRDPMFGYPDVNYASSAHELLEFLQYPKTTPLDASLLNISKHLDLWQSLLYGNNSN